MNVQHPHQPPLQKYPLRTATLILLVVQLIFHIEENIRRSIVLFIATQRYAIYYYYQDFWFWLGYAVAFVVFLALTIGLAGAAKQKAPLSLISGIILFSDAIYVTVLLSLYVVNLSYITYDFYISVVYVRYFLIF